MSEQVSTPPIPENQSVAGQVGVPLAIILKGEANVPPPGPGSMQMTRYDPSFLRFESCGWYPAGELAPDAATLRVIFIPSTVGQTDVEFQVRPQAINPLYLPVRFHVTINS